MGKLLEGKVAIVTGSGRGLGSGMARLLAEYGARVVVNDFGGSRQGEGASMSPADEVIAEIKAAGGEAVANYENVADFKAARRIIDCALDNFGKLNILVNNAGIVRDKTVASMSEEDWDAVINVHLKGTFNCSRHACSYWRSEYKDGRNHDGRIINTLSDAGLMGNMGQGNYGAAKGGMAILSLVMAIEMGRYSVTSNCVAPVARTRITTEGVPPEMAAAMQPKPGEFDVMDFNNVAPLVVYLASDMAKDINGEVIRLVGNKIWLVRGWHNIDEAAKTERVKWLPEELDEPLKEMVRKAPPKDDATRVINNAVASV